jgi:putative transposase
MARPLRIEFEHALYHITSRGDRREDIYVDDVDRQAWISVLAQVCERFNWVVHAYCLMSNHYHLVVETPDANLSVGMRQLNGVYTQLVNRRHARVGHVFQGRFKAIVVQKEAYLLELARYVVLNPVRAGMVSDVGDWPWSSYAAMMAAPHLPRASWLATDKLLAYFAPQAKPDSTLRFDKTKAQQRYADHVRAGVGLPSIWDSLKGQIFLGDEGFVRSLTAQALDKRAGKAQTDGQTTQAALQEIPKAQRRGTVRPIAHYQALHPNQRDAAIRAAFASGGYTMSQLAQHFQLHYTSISRIVKQVELT